MDTNVVTSIARLQVELRKLRRAAIDAAIGHAEIDAMLGLCDEALDGNQSALAALAAIGYALPPFPKLESN